MTTLRVGVVNGLTDDEIIAIRQRVRTTDYDPWADTLAFAREVERMSSAATLGAAIDALAGERT